MSSLHRYKKSGGFVQLLSLIETFGPQKRDKFLEMIEQENAVWAKALREKALTIERIFSWADQVVIEVLKGLPIKNMAVVIEGLKEDQKARMMVFFTPSDKRRLEDALLNTKPKPEEIGANMVKLVELARKMLMDGDLRAEKFDEGLLIPEDIEAQLEGQSVNQFAQKMAEGGASAPAHASSKDAAHGGGHDHSAISPTDLHQLQRTLATLMSENKKLKEDVRIMRDKLDQIKKIA